MTFAAFLEKNFQTIINPYEASDLQQKNNSSKTFYTLITKSFISLHQGEIIFDATGCGNFPEKRR